MLCRALLAAVAVTYLICVLVLSGMQKEDLDVTLLRKLQRHNIYADDVYSDKVHQECQLNSSSELSILQIKRNNDGSRNHNNTNFVKDGFNETKDKSSYEMGITKDHNIKTRSSVTDVNSTQAEKFREAMTFFGDQKNVDNVMNMLQTFLKARLMENNNTDFFKSSASIQITTTPPTKPTENAIESKNKESDMIKVLATFVFDKPIPVDPHYKMNDEKNSLLSKLLDNKEAKSGNRDKPDEYINDDTGTTELFSDHEYLSYKTNTAEITSSVDDDYKPSVQSNLDHMMNEFRMQSKIKPKHILEYDNDESAFVNSQTESLYVQDLKNIIKHQANQIIYNQQREADDSEYPKLVDIIKQNKRDKNMKNELAKSLQPNIIKEIADKVKEIVLRDLKKEILPTTETSRSTVITQKIMTKIPQKFEKITMSIPQLEKNNIQEATHAIQKFVELLEQLKSAKESPLKYDLSKKAHKNNEFHGDAKERDSKTQMKPVNKTPAGKQNDLIKMKDYRPKVAKVNGYKMPEYNVPMQYHQRYPIGPYNDNAPNKMVPPLVSNPYGVQQPGGRAIINVPQEMPRNNKLNTINIITPVNHTPVININQMRPAPIMIQTSKEIPPLGIPVSMSASLNRNIVMPVMTTLNETERQKWAYIMKYGRNPDNRGELTDFKDKLTQYTNFKSTPTKQGPEKNIGSSILKFSLTNQPGKLPDYTKFSFPSINVQDKRGDSTVFGSSLINTRGPDRKNDPKMFNSPTVTKQEQQRLMGFKKYNLPNMNVYEPDKTRSAKTFNSLDKQERERMIDPTVSTGDQFKDTTMKKHNTNYKQVYDEAVLSDIKTKLLYKDKYKTNEEYRALTNHQPLTLNIADIPKRDYYERPNVYNPRFLEASANYPNIDPYVKRDYNYFSKRKPYHEYIDISKPSDLYVPKKDPVSKEIHDIKGFHEKLERDDYERLDPESYESPTMPRQYAMNNIKHDETDYSKTNIESRQQLPLSGGTRMSKFDDTHFKNFLKTQQKVNDMLERILATKISNDYAPSVETT